jgi:hypothetical protein
VVIPFLSQINIDATASTYGAALPAIVEWIDQSFCAPAKLPFSDTTSAAPALNHQNKLPLLLLKALSATAATRWDF